MLNPGYFNNQTCYLWARHHAPPSHITSPLSRLDYQRLMPDDSSQHRWHVGRLPFNCNCWQGELDLICTEVEDISIKAPYVSQSYTAGVSFCQSGFVLPTVLFYVRMLLEYKYNFSFKSFTYVEPLNRLYIYRILDTLTGPIREEVGLAEEVPLNTITIVLCGIQIRRPI